MPKSNIPYEKMIQLYQTELNIVLFISEMIVYHLTVNYN